MPIAFFDLDRTLLSVNSAELWMKREFREGHVTRWQAARAAAWIATYHAGFAKLERALEAAIASLAGQEEGVISERTHCFYAEELARAYRPRARTVLDQHRARGHTLALLTASSVYLSEDAGRDLDIPHLLCNRFEVREGRFTGRTDPGVASGTLCYGPGKLRHAQALAESLGERLEDAWFYTDSVSDLTVLRAVGNPVAVHPDSRLRKEARKAGWPIEDWGG